MSVVSTHHEPPLASTGVEGNSGDSSTDHRATPNLHVELKLVRDDGSCMDASVASESANGSNIDTSDLLTKFVRFIPYEFARRHLILPAHDAAASPTLLAASTTGPAAVFNACVALGQQCELRRHDAESLASMIDAVYAQAKRTAMAKFNQPQMSATEDLPLIELEASLDVAADLKAAMDAVDSDLLATSGKNAVVRLVDLILFEALTRKASDVHIQPLADRTLVRYRLDGVLHTVRELPAGLANSVTSRIKVMGRMDVAEQRAPQDGRATVTLGNAHERRHANSAMSSAATKHSFEPDGGDHGRRIDLRLSTMPTTYGERVVVRVLDNARSTHLLSFSALGMPATVQDPFLQQAARTSGIVLVTGPTGSGKTTTLYTTLKWITQQRSGPPSRQSCTDHAHDEAISSHTQTRAAPRGDRLGGCELNIMTIEDPVEYDLSVTGLAVSQTPVNPKKNVTFATGLRHILRQDPDVIMVGEIRDDETARIAVQASLTGHLVLSTLHTNDAASAVARLIDLHVEPFLVSSSLAAVLAQRLVRRVHSPCDNDGCDACFNTGYQGRTGVFELLVLDEQLREEVNKSVPAAVIRQMAMGKGMTTLLRAGEQLASERVTTMSEVARVIQGIE